MTTAFDEVFHGQHCRLETDHGVYEVLTPAKWRAQPDLGDEFMLRQCHGPTLDIGCGPGRLTRALLARGQPALGVDTSRTAVRMARLRGGLALRCCVFDPIPGEGRWAHALLADGNLGIGGDPTALLRRIRELLRPGGTAIVEAHPPGTGVWSGWARFGNGPWFRWAKVSIDAVGELASGLSMRLEWTHHQDGRWLAEILRPR